MGCGLSKPAQKPTGHQTVNQNPSPTSEVVRTQEIVVQVDNKNPAPKGSGVSKTERANTKAEDIEAIVMINDITLDVSQLSMTDMLSNAKVLVDIVVFLLKSNLAKNQFLKAVLRRMQSLEPCFTELQKKNSTLTKQPVINLIHVVNKIKSVCEKMLAEDKSFWERIKDVVTANAQLSELMSLNDTLSKVQADLLIPLQLDEAKKIDKMFEYLQKVTEQGSVTYKSVENQPTVLPLAKRKLKNEEAFIFWFECFPNSYLVEIDDFKRTFKDYISETAKKQIKAGDLDRIVILIKEDDATAAKIDAGQVNKFFESLPLDVPWENIASIEKDIKEVKQKKAAETEQLLKQEQNLLQEKVKKIENEENDEEKKLSKDANYVRLLVSEAWLRQQKKKQGLQFRNIFISMKTGELRGYGISKDKPFTMTGRIDQEGNLAITLSFEGDDQVQINGQVKVHETAICLEGKSAKYKLEIHFDLDYWFGYYEQQGEPNDMQVFLKIVGDQASGISCDNIGIAVWKGTLGSEFKMNKQYVQQHSVSYSGKIKKKASGMEITGNWFISNTITDKFYLSYALGADDEEDEDESDEDEEEDFSHCPRNHEMKWSNQRGNYRGTTFGCDNCAISEQISTGRWNCATCKYDICMDCKKPPESLTKVCSNNHALKWDTTQGNYPYPSYICNICRSDGKTAKGRWHCKSCQYDVCKNCRSPPFA